MSPRTTQSNPGLAARRNLETLKHLLTSSSTPGGTPDTLETQPPWSSNTEDMEAIQEDGGGNVDISTEIEDLIHFVDKFQFRSPLAVPLRNRTIGTSVHRRSPDPPQSSARNYPVNNKNTTTTSSTKIPQTAPVGRRLPLTERTNHSFCLHDMEAAKSNLHDTLLLAKESAATTVTTSPSQQDPEGLPPCSDDSSVLDSLSKQDEEEEMVVTEQDWEKFNQLVQQVETSLHEARTEKEAARIWARDVRASTESWVEEQRLWMEQERTTPWLLTGEGEVDKGENRSTTSGGNNMALYETRIDRLEHSIRGLELDLRTTELHHQTNEKRLLGIIQYQQDKLRTLEGCKGIRTERVSPRGVWEIPHTMVAEDSARTPKPASTPYPSTRLSGHNKRDILRTQSFGGADRLLTGHQTDILRTQSFGGVDQDEASVVQKKICFTEDTVDTGVPMDAGAENSYHKPFVGATPASSGIKTLQSRSSASRSSGRRSVTFPNGAERITRSDGSSTIRFPNGDVQISSPDPNRSVAYYHADSKVIQVATMDGSEIYEFPNKQVERHYPDGRKIVKFPDGTKKRVFADGTVETFLSCGTAMVVEHLDGTKDVQHL